MYLRESSSDLSANRNVCDDTAIQNRRRQRSHEAGAAVDTISASSSWDTVSDANDDDSDDRILHTQFSIGSSNDWRHQHDDVVTPVRRVTSDVTGIPPRHSTPIISRPRDVIERTPATVGDDRILRTQFSIGSSNDQRHQHDDVVTPVRHVTSDVTGIPLQHSTPIISRPRDVIERTPANVSAPDLSG